MLRNFRTVQGTYKIYQFAQINSKQQKQDLRNLLMLLKPELKICLWGLGVVTLSSAALVYIPQAFKHIGQLQELKLQHSEDSQADEIHNKKVYAEYTYFAVKWGLICALSGALGFSRRYINQNISNRISVRLRNALFQKFLLERSNNSTQSAQLVHRLSNDVSLISNGLSMDILIGIRGILTTIGGAAFLCYEALPLLPPALGIMLVFALSTRTILRYQRHFKVLETESLGQCSELAQEKFQAYRIIKVSNMEQTEIQRYFAQLCRFYQNAKQHSLYQALNMAMVEGVGFASLLGILAYGSFLISTGQAEAGLVASSIYALYVGTGFRTLINTYSELTKTAGIYHGLAQLCPNLHLDPLYLQKNLLQTYESLIEIDDQNKQKVLTPPQNSEEDGIRQYILDLMVLYDQEHTPPPKVEFVNICYGFEGHQPILTNFNRVVESGKVVVLVGKSGSGKSTLLNMLTKLIEPNQGDILIDGESIKNKDFKWIQRYVSYMPQDATIFTGSIYENIIYGNQGFDQSLERVMQAAKMARAHDFIQNMPNGYLTQLRSDGVVSLSGGQKQRIVLARAILKNPKILILDEATSNIDSLAEQEIVTALKEIANNKTCFIVTHKIENYHSLIQEQILL